MGNKIESNSFKKKEAYSNVLLILVLFIVSFALRFYSSKFHIVMVPDYDGLAYIEMAKNAADGRFFSGIGYHPFYSWLLALVESFTRDYQWAGMLVSIVTGSFTIVTVFLLTKFLFDLRTGLISALFLTIYPLHVLVSTFVFTEATFTLLIYSGLYLGWQAYKKKKWAFGLAFGIIMGLAYLTRPEGFLVFMGMILFLLFIVYKEKDKNLIPTVLIAFTAFSFVALPYMSYLKRETGHWTISGKELTNLPEVKNEQISQRIDADVNKLSHLSLLREIIEDPKLFFERYKNNLVITANTFKERTGWLILLLSFVGYISVFINRTHSQYKYSMIYLALFMVPILFTPLLHPLEDRLAIPYLTIFLISSSYGVGVVQEISDKICSRVKICEFAKRYRVTSLMLVLSIVVILGYALTCEIRVHQEKQAAEWFSNKYIGSILNNLSSSEDTIMTREPLQAFYADRKSIGLPYGNVRDVLDYAKKHKASFLVINREIVMRKRPLLKPLLYPFYDQPDKKILYNLLGSSAEEMGLIEERLKVVYAIGHSGIIIYKII